MATKASKRKTSRSRQSLKNRGTTKSRGGGGVPTKAKTTARGGGGLVIHFAYTRLRNSTLAELLRQFEEIKDLSVVEYLQLANSQIEKIPSFTIVAMHTGQSLKYSYGGGLVPKIKKEGNDYILSVSAKIAIPVIVAYYLFKGFDTYLDMQNKLKDSKIKDQEIELNKLQIEKEQDEKSERDTKKQNKVNTATVQFIEYIQKHPEITSFQVNGKTIKPLPKSKSE
jgi:hypothetical protein